MNKEFRLKLYKFFAREAKLDVYRLKLKKMESLHDMQNLKDFGICHGQTATVKSILQLISKFVDNA